MAKKYSQEWWLEQRPEVVGKETERIVQAILVEANKEVDFAWHRLPDAKSARGVLAAQPADFMLIRNGRFIFLEIKAVKHPYRLPAARLTQLPTLKKWVMAGATCAVLIHHYTDGVWRIVDASELESGAPSWDLRGCETFSTANGALQSIGVVE